MDLARLAAFDDKTHLRTRAFANEVVVNTGHRKQRRNRSRSFVKPRSERMMMP